MIKWRIIKPIKTQIRRKVQRSSNMTTMIETKLPMINYLYVFFLSILKLPLGWQIRPSVKDRIRAFGHSDKVAKVRIAAEFSFYDLIVA